MPPGNTTRPAASISRAPAARSLPSVATMLSFMPMSQTVVSAAVATVPLRITRSYSLMPVLLAVYNASSIGGRSSATVVLQSASRERDRHDRSIVTPPDHRRYPARNLGGPLSRGHRRVRHLAGGRQRDRCGLRRRYRARCPAERSRRCRRRLREQVLPPRQAGGRDDSRARPLAEGARPTALPARARRQDPEGGAANRRAGRSCRLDRRAPALWHDELWRGRGGRDTSGSRRFSDVSADG